MEGEKLARIDESIKQITKTLDSHDKKLEQLEKTYGVMMNLNYRMANVENAIKSIDNKLDQNSVKKGKKWDKLIDYIFYALVSFVLLKLGLKG